jgi:hypothetical protein
VLHTEGCVYVSCCIQKAVFTWRAAYRRLCLRGVLHTEGCVYVACYILKAVCMLHSWDRCVEKQSGHVVSCVVLLITSLRILFDITCAFKPRIPSMREEHKFEALGNKVLESVWVQGAE